MGQDGDGERSVGSLRAELQVEDQQPQQQAQSEEQLHLHLGPAQVQPLSEQLPHPAPPPLYAAHPHLTVQLLSQQVNIILKIRSDPRNLYSGALDHFMMTISVLLIFIQPTKSPDTSFEF